jgi:hypothetical protein
MKSPSTGTRYPDASTLVGSEGHEALARQPHPLMIGCTDLADERADCSVVPCDYVGVKVEADSSLT